MSASPWVCEKCGRGWDESFHNKTCVCGGVGTVVPRERLAEGKEVASYLRDPPRLRGVRVPRRPTLDELDRDRREE